jgi:hypothetical protein
MSELVGGRKSGRSTKTRKPAEAVAEEEDDDEEEKGGGGEGGRKVAGK